MFSVSSAASNCFRPWCRAIEAVRGKLRHGRSTQQALRSKGLGCSGVGITAFRGSGNLWLRALCLDSAVFMARGIHGLGLQRCDPQIHPVV